MSASLSVLLPVHNAQATLEGDAARLLEILPELTPQFDVLIVDDGSSDATPEIAHELTRRFPQISVVRHTRKQGWAQALRTGMPLTRGEMIFVHDAESPIDPDDVIRTWHERQSGDGNTARNDAPASALDGPFWQRLRRYHEQAVDMRIDRPSCFHVLKRPALDGRRDGQYTASQHKATADTADRAVPVTPNYLLRLRQWSLSE